MNYILEAVIYIFNGVLLAWYCSAFLLPKLKRRYMANIGLALSYVILRYAVEYLPAGHLPDPVYAIMKTVVMAIAMFGLSFVFFKKELGKQFFLLISFFAVLDMCSFITLHAYMLITDSFLYLFGGSLFGGIPTAQQFETYQNIFAVINGALLFLIHAFVFFIAIRSIARGFTYSVEGTKPLDTMDKVLKANDVLAITLPCVTMLAVSFTMMTVIFGMPGGDQILHGTSGALLTAVALFLLLTLVASVRLVQKTIAMHIEEKDTAVVREQIKHIKNQDYDNIYAQLLGFRHDMKNHLVNIGLLAKSAVDGDAKAHSEMINYISQMDAAVEEMCVTHDTGNPVTDVIIGQRFIEAEKKHIKLDSDFTYPAQLGIDTYDLAVILSNALDNAFEACDGVTESERYVSISSRIKGNTFLIKVKNSYAGDVAFDEHTNLPLSDKNDSAGHGFGLINIQRFSHKYFGDIDISLSQHDDVKAFCLKVMLQGKS